MRVHVVCLCLCLFLSKQFRSLIQKMNEWLQQHQESNEQAEETQTAPVGEESASVLLARATELSDTLWRFERELDDDDDCEASTSGSGLATDPEESLVEPKPEAPSADPKPEPSSP